MTVTQLISGDIATVLKGEIVKDCQKDLAAKKYDLEIGTCS